MNKKRILLIATGGTIACKKSENGLTPQMDGKELLQYVKEVEQYSIVDTITLFIKKLFRRKEEGNNNE